MYICYRHEAWLVFIFLQKMKQEYLNWVINALNEIAVVLHINKLLDSRKRVHHIQIVQTERNHTENVYLLDFHLFCSGLLNSCILSAFCRLNEIKDKIHKWYIRIWSKCQTAIFSRWKLTRLKVNSISDWTDEKSQNSHHLTAIFSFLDWTGTMHISNFCFLSGKGWGRGRTTLSSFTAPPPTPTIWSLSYRVFTAITYCAKKYKSFVIFPTHYNFNFVVKVIWHICKTLWNKLIFT